eukprot:TRINITY_DN8466_c0_g1_i3.p1 TRINITY_DN8466_c0_g1~~TRINITY_DN8466_c0_g1_i3.p1  ORF type:complete len:166 (+),score=20.89 TRINITY_DN8466_c0_g1_i3:52-549(+)
MSRATLTERVILHIDLDCFYCQVEQQRLNVPSTTPAVVQQHNALIAVNYPARAFGVKRMDKIDVAVKKCPSLVLMKVEMIDGKVSLERYREASSRIFEVFSEHGSCERASIDEAYMDGIFAHLLFAVLISCSLAIVVFCSNFILLFCNHANLVMFFKKNNLYEMD